MTLQEAIEARHSVRAYKNEPLADDAVKILEEQIAILNREGQLHMQLILNEPKAFYCHGRKEGCESARGEQN